MLRFIRRKFKLTYLFRPMYFLVLDAKDKNIGLGENINDFCQWYDLERLLIYGVKRRSGQVRVKYYFPMITIFGFKNKHAKGE